MAGRSLPDLLDESSRCRAALEKVANLRFQFPQGSGLAFRPAIISEPLVHGLRQVGIDLANFGGVLVSEIGSPLAPAPEDIQEAIASADESGFNLEHVDDIATAFGRKYGRMKACPCKALLKCSAAKRGRSGVCRRSSSGASKPLSRQLRTRCRRFEIYAVPADSGKAEST